MRAHKCQFCQVPLTDEDKFAMDNICECCFEEQLDGQDLEDQLERLLKCM